MQFFGRTKEIARLHEIDDMSVNVAAQFTIITGRRRIGKTSLVLKAFEGRPLLYFFVAKKTEAQLVEGFQAEIESKLGITALGNAQSFSQVFEFLMKLSHERHFTVMIDEFQEFFRVNPSVYSDMQRIWDLHKNGSKLNLIVCGSVNTLMNKIFRDNKEPLYGRHTQQLSITPFSTTMLKEILKSVHPNYENEDLLALYAITGGVARYVELMLDSGAVDRNSMLKALTNPYSLFIDEGKAILVEEFGREYSVYFSILMSIATGHTSRKEIEDMAGRQISGHLDRLENDYGLIKKKIPLFSSSKNKTVRYSISDNFLILWFRFFYKYNYLLEIGGHETLRSIIERDYDTFSGFALERYFTQRFIEQGQCTRLGGWWQRNGTQEIDIIAANEIDRVATFYEVKRNSDRINLQDLRYKAQVFLEATHEFKKFKIECAGLSINDM